MKASMQLKTIINDNNLAFENLSPDYRSTGRLRIMGIVRFLGGEDASTNRNIKT